MTKKLRIAALCAACVFVLFFVFSAVLSCFVTNHDCCGEDCALCLCINLSRNVQRHCYIAVTAVIAVLSVACIRMFCARCAACRRNASLVCLKVKLSD